MGEALHLSFGQEKKLPNGTRVVVERKKKPHERKKPGKTARHEARHAVTAERNGTRVISASVIPGPGYLGVTFLSGFDAAAAAAPDAHGDSGTGHDLNIIKMAGVSVEGARNSAVAILRGNREHVEAVAVALDESGTLSGNKIRGIMHDIDSGYEVTIKIISAEGKTATKTSRVYAKDNSIAIHESELPRAA